MMRGLAPARPPFPRNAVPERARQPRLLRRALALARLLALADAMTAGGCMIPVRVAPGGAPEPTDRVPSAGSEMAKKKML
jgi:hypothetical protein